MTQANLPVSLSDMTQWRSKSFDGHSLDVLLNNEAVQKRALDNVLILLDLLRSFGGDEVIEYPRTDREIDADQI